MDTVEFSTRKPEDLIHAFAAWQGIRDEFAEQFCAVNGLGKPTYEMQEGKHYTLPRIKSQYEEDTDRRRREETYRMIRWKPLPAPPWWVRLKLWATGRVPWRMMHIVVNDSPLSVPRFECPLPLPMRYVNEIARLRMHDDSGIYDFEDLGQSTEAEFLKQVDSGVYIMPWRDEEYPDETTDQSQAGP